MQTCEVCWLNGAERGIEKLFFLGRFVLIIQQIVPQRLSKHLSFTM